MSESSMVFQGLQFDLFEFKKEFYVVRELTGQERDTFLSTMKKKVDTSDPTKPKVKDHTGLNSLLLSFAAEKIVSVAGLSSLPDTLDGLKAKVEELSLQYDSFHVEPVSHTVTQGWGSGMTESLTKVAQALSGLNVVKDEKKE